MELTSLTLSEASQLIAEGKLSPVELVEAHLARIERLEPQLNCFITLTPELALERARQAEAEIRRGEYLGPLHGIPLALKDLYETQGVRTTAGSTFFRDFVPEADAFVVDRLKAAGVVFLGKLNMHEIALGVTNNNPHYGACHNPWSGDHLYSSKVSGPWSLERSPGGSSGGSAAALAAGLCLGSLGSDTGGSIRIPAALCGVVGLKPTYGRVSLRGVTPLSWNLDHPGPLARRARDVATLLQAIAGYDPLDPASVDVPVPDYAAGLEGSINSWRVALAGDAFFTKAEPEVLAAVRAAGEVFRSLGARLAEVEVPNGLEAARANGLMVTSDAAAVHRRRLENNPEMFGADVRQRLETGAAYSSTEYALARRVQTEFRRQLERFFEEHDLLLTPATPIPAPPLEGPDAVEQAGRLTRFTAPFNLSGLPAISVPCGFTAEGLPLGLQLVAPPWGEPSLLRAAHAYEEATEWHLRRPDL
jgi:aspartyl-tRNA(Asn)/glutamyl-tRNA(Gln) amidotransferase subunit A